MDVSPGRASSQHHSRGRVPKSSSLELSGHLHQPYTSYEAHTGLSRRGSPQHSGKFTLGYATPTPSGRDPDEDEIHESGRKELESTLFFGSFLTSKRIDVNDRKQLLYRYNAAHTRV